LSDKSNGTSYVFNRNLGIVVVRLCCTRVLGCLSVVHGVAVLCADPGVVLGVILAIGFVVLAYSGDLVEDLVLGLDALAPLADADLVTKLFNSVIFAFFIL